MNHPTKRELEVLEMVTRPGYTQARAARELGISTWTVKNHLTGLYRKLEVRTAAQALRALSEAA